MPDPESSPSRRRGSRRSPLELDPAGSRELARAFKLVADASRLKVLSLLSQGETHVRALCEALGHDQAAMSHHLTLLRVAGLIQGTRDGSYIRYALTDQGWTVVSVIAVILGE